MKRLFVSLLLAALAGCASGPQDSGPAVPADGDGPPLSDTDAVRAALRAQHAEWQGVPYRLGGTTRQGIDCSAFVATTFQRRLGMRLPRVTDDQAALGRRVARDALRAGDLVFFKTSWQQKHVGIYLKGDRFLHASTSAGVTVSSLRNPYWAGHWWQARRLRKASR